MTGGLAYVIDPDGNAHPAPQCGRGRRVGRACRRGCALASRSLPPSRRGDGQRPRAGPAAELAAGTRRVPTHRGAARGDTARPLGVRRRRGPPSPAPFSKASRRGTRARSLGPGSVVASAPWEADPRTRRFPATDREAAVFPFAAGGARRGSRRLDAVSRARRSGPRIHTLPPGGARGRDVPRGVRRACRHPRSGARGTRSRAALRPRATPRRGSRSITPSPAPRPSRR
jgi:hypothetical protein